MLSFPLTIQIYAKYLEMLRNASDNDPIIFTTSRLTTKNDPLSYSTVEERNEANSNKYFKSLKNIYEEKIFLETINNFNGRESSRRVRIK